MLPLQLLNKAQQYSYSTPESIIQLNISYQLSGYLKKAHCIRFGEAKVHSSLKLDVVNFLTLDETGAAATTAATAGCLVGV